MNNLKRIIWLQSIFSEEFVKESAAVSPAANIWQYNFIKNLKKLDIETYCVGYNYEPVFPNGKNRVHNSFVDPSRSSYDSDEHALEVYRNTVKEISAWIDSLSFTE